MQEEIQEEIIVRRPPVVTVMGHIDHGKTSLLDAIRNTNVASKEIGHITQHIGAYKVKFRDEEIIFIDTPGHEAFTSLRVRGVKVTDIVILVVAVNEGVMPQSIEAISHAKAANVPIIVAINKIDLPVSNTHKIKIKEELAKYGLVAEEWGGDTVFVEISAKYHKNLDELLELVVLSGQLLDLRTVINKKARGVVLEARLDSRRGPVATVLIQEGRLRIGEVFVAGMTWGKVRNILDDNARFLKEAVAVSPVEILGFEKLAVAGDRFFVVDSIKSAKEHALQEEEKMKRQTYAPKRVFSLQDLYKKKEDIKELPLILKADGWGSIEAASFVLSKLQLDKIKVNLLHKGVGNITEGDLLLASASSAIIVSFGIVPSLNIERQAKALGVEVRNYQVIYDLIDDVKRALEGLLEPQIEEVVIGKLEIRRVFRVAHVGHIAGCYVREGRVERGALCKVLRNSSIIYEGKISSLRRFKEDVASVSSGFECGVGIDGIKDLSEGDIILVYQRRLIKQKIECKD